DVDVKDAILRSQLQDIPEGREKPGAVDAIQRLTGVEERLAQVGGRSEGLELRPERVHGLLAMEAMARRQGEQLDQGRRLALTPGVVSDHVRADGNAKPGEELDAQIGHASAPSAYVSFAPNQRARHDGPEKKSTSTRPTRPAPNSMEQEPRPSSPSDEPPGTAA